MPRFRTLALGAVLTLPASARADIPPDPDSADAHCTPAEQCPSGEYCDYAFRPGKPEGDWKAVGAECRTSVESRGLERRCRNGGNYSGRHLYCPRGEKGSWSPGGASSAQPTPAPTPPAPTPPAPTPPAPAPAATAPTPPAPATAPTPAAPAPAPAPAPAKDGGFCSVTEAPGPAALALLLLLALRRRRR